MLPDTGHAAKAAGDSHPSNLAVLWDSQNGEISRFDLVRTFGLDG
jgi:hypothetical protein